MSRKTQKINKANNTIDNIKAQKQAELDMKADQECAAEIEVVLKKYGRGIQPFLQYQEFGLIPAVRLAKLKEPQETEKVPE